ncbi:DUF2970 domain-containing protein [Pseudoalteromonas fenneropenaei]|uniref:DUF2970 domain-containing protein n=1 Tax=Pseudoalteromonas fenneropenaei TaxID=1737459 RepID=A0ABV7CN74_9GAMM
MRWLSVMQSVLAAMFGVQSDAKRHQDFTAPHPLPYIIFGIILVVLFVLGLVYLVQLVLPNSLEQ